MSTTAGGAASSRRHAPRSRAMYQKGGGFYTRKWEGGRDRWIALGTEYEDACRRLREFLPAGIGLL